LKGSKKFWGLPGQGWGGGEGGCTVKKKKPRNNNNGEKKNSKPRQTYHKGKRGKNCRPGNNSDNTPPSGKRWCQPSQAPTRREHERKKRREGERLHIFTGFMDGRLKSERVRGHKKKLITRKITPGKKKGPKEPKLDGEKIEKQHRPRKLKNINQPKTTTKKETR